VNLQEGNPYFISAWCRENFSSRLSRRDSDRNHRFLQVQLFSVLVSSLQKYYLSYNEDKYSSGNSQEDDQLSFSAVLLHRLLENMRFNLTMRNFLNNNN